MDTDLQFCATDQEIFDILMSARLRLSDAVLFEISKDRGIIFSGKESRSDLANAIALMGHGHHDVAALLARREPGNRNDPVTSIELPAMTVEQAKEIVKGFRNDAKGFDRIVASTPSSASIKVEVEYSEVDHSRTRLLQRRKREASVDIEIQDGKTIVRVPSTEKGELIAEALIQGASVQLPSVPVVANRIEVSVLVSAQARTEFFIRMMQKLKSFSLINVTKVSAMPWTEVTSEDEEDFDADEQENLPPESDEESGELLSAVRQIALDGTVLLASPLYQQIRESGFALTAVKWVSQEAHSNSQYEFEASFDRPREGKGFRYKIRGVRRYDAGVLLKTLRPVPPDQVPVLYGLIEDAANAAIEELIKIQESANTVTS